MVQLWTVELLLYPLSNRASEGLLALLAHAADEADQFGALFLVENRPLIPRTTRGTSLVP